MSEQLSVAWIEHFRESARGGVLPTAKGTEVLLAHIDAQAATIQRVRETHDGRGFHYFGRLPGQPMPDPEGEAYCSHCGYTAPCPTVRALDTTAAPTLNDGDTK